MKIAWKLLVVLVICLLFALIDHLTAPYLDFSEQGSRLHIFLHHFIYIAFGATLGKVFN